MRIKWKGILMIGVFVLCMVVWPSKFVDAADSALIEFDSGAIAKRFESIASYREKKDNEGYYTSVPESPTGYENYIFAGWYKDEKCTEKISGTESPAYAKFVPQEILSVKAQLLSGTGYDSTQSAIRFITTVDSLNYQKVGFQFEVKGNTREYDTYKVYRKLYAMSDDGTILEDYTPDVFHYMSKYFMLFRIVDITNEDFGHGVIITPYWVTLDGTKVYGVTDLKTANMGYTSMLAEVTTTNVKKFDKPVSSFAQNPYSAIVSEGGGTDGTYYYQAVINKYARQTDADGNYIYDSSGNPVYDESENGVIIQKYRMSDWELVGQSLEMSLYHSNDITYNSELVYDKDGESKQGLLVLCRNGDWGEKNQISFIDRDDLTIINPSNIEMEWDSTVTLTDEYIEVAEQLYCIEYNATTNRYVVGMAGKQSFKIMDASFQFVSDEFVPTDRTESYTTQGVGADDAYVYFVLSNPNVMAVYDWNGNFTTLIPLTGIESTIAPENIGVYNNQFYISCNTTNYTWIYHVETMTSTKMDSSQDEATLLNNTMAVDIYTETTVKVLGEMSNEGSCSGLRVENGNNQMIDFVLTYDSETQMLANVAVVESSTGEQRVYSIDSALEFASATGIKLAIAKHGSTFYFYVNDVLQATRGFDGFGDDVTVAAALYSKYTNSDFYGYSVETDSEKIEEKLATLHDVFVADDKTEKSEFDLLEEEADRNPKVTVNGKLENGSIVNWYGVSEKQLLAESFIKIADSNDVNGGNACAGIVLTDAANGNRFYIMLTGDAETITSLECYSMTNEDFAGKTKEYTKDISLTGKHKLTVSRIENQLMIALDGVKQTEIDLSAVTNPITDNSAVGLVGWMAKATFTGYNIMPGNYESDITKSQAAFVLNKTAATDVYAETTVQVSDYSSQYWSRAGLRFTNEAGEHVVFALGYNPTTGNLENVVVVKVNKNGTDIDGTKQSYSIDSVKEAESIKLAVAKIGNMFYFYVNDVLQGTKTYSRFGSSNKVTASLYSKYTTSTFFDFSDYSTNVSTINTKIESFTDIFVADKKKSIIYFDILNEANKTEPKITTNETGAWKESSIVNWNGVSDTKFYAETTVKLEKSNEKGSNVGFVLTNGSERFFVMLTGSEEGITSLDCYSMTNDVMDNYNAETNPNGKVNEYTQQVSLSNENKLAIYRCDNKLFVFVNNQVQTIIDLANVQYPITEASKVGLAGWKSQATFTNYDIKVEDDAPTLQTYNPLFVQENLSSSYVWDTQISTTNNQIVLGVQSTDKTKIQTMKLSESATADIYAETTVVIPEVDTDKYARTGLRLTTVTDEGASKHLDFVLGYAKNEETPTFNKVYIVQRDAEDNEAYISKTLDSPFAPGSTQSMTLAVAKSGDTLYFYLEGVLINTVQDEFFGIDAQVTASLLSQYTVARYSGYSASEGYKSDVAEKADTMALNVEAVADVYAETVVKVTEASTSAWPRVGLRLTNGAETNVDYVVAFNKNTTPTYNSFFAIQTDANSNDISGTKVSFTLTSELQEALTTTGVKIAVAKINGTLYFYANNVLVGTTTYEGFGADDVVTASLYSKVTESTFTEYGLPEIGKTVSLAGDTFAEAKTTKNLVIADGVPNMEVQITGCKSSAHGYMYFKEKSTKVYAEAVVDLPTTTSTEQQRAGLALTDENKSAQLGVYLFAADGTSDVTKLQIYALSGFANDWGTQAANVDITKIEGLENIGREDINLSLLRDGDNYTVCINGVEAATGTLSAISSFNITSTTETYIGLIGMQQSATFSKFTYSYGDAVN